MAGLGGLVRAGLVALLVVLGGGGVSAAYAQQGGEVPGGASGSRSDSDLWRDIRRGEQGNVSLPDKRVGVLIQSEGDNWRARRNGPVSVYGSWLLLAAVVGIALFFAMRGRIRIEEGPSGRQVLRFTFIERFGHWLTAVSFIVLALTGLNVLYGRYVQPPLIGQSAFAAVTLAGKYTHHFVAFAFMAGLALIIVLWIRHNLPDRYDLGWIRDGGGLLRKGVHPPAGKFNFGQKVVFWGVVLGGLAVSATGLNLMFPFYADMQQMQWAQLIHAIAALLLTALIIGHIYIGTLGMEGAIGAMVSGRVDENWAKEHHSAWIDDLHRRDTTPAE